MGGGDGQVIFDCATCNETTEVDVRRELEDLVFYLDHRHENWNELDHDWSSDLTFRELTLDDVHQLDVLDDLATRDDFAGFAMRSAIHAKRSIRLGRVLWNDRYVEGNRFSVLSGFARAARRSFRNVAQVGINAATRT